MNKHSIHLPLPSLNIDQPKVQGNLLVTRDLGIEKPRKKREKRAIPPTKQNKRLSIITYDNQTEFDLKKLHPSLPLQSLYFLQLIMAPVRSGKTTYLLNMLREYQLVHDFFYIVSPTAALDPKVSGFKFVENKKNQYGDERMLQVIDEPTKIDKLVEHLINLSEHGPVGVAKTATKKKPRIFLMIDDFSGYADIANPTSPLGKLVFQRRHHGVTMIICTHSARRTPKFMRENADMVTFIGKHISQNDIDYMREEQTLYSKDVLQALFKLHNASDHPITSFDNMNNRIISGFCDEVIISDDEVDDDE